MNSTVSWPSSACSSTARRRRRGAALLAALLLAGCRPEAGGGPGARLPPEAVDGNRAYTEVVRFLALGPRVANTPGARRAADHIAERIRALGLEPRTDVFTDDQNGSRAEFRNVTALCPGANANQWIVLLSHFDSKAGISDTFAGANDGGSSTGLLLELMRVCRQHPPPCHLLFAFVDGEEARVEYGPRDGFHGSRRLAAELARRRESGIEVAAVIVLDMIGDRDLNLTLPRNCTPALLQAAFAAARDEGIRDRVTLDPRAIGDDHVPFLAQGFPALDLIDFEYGSARGLNDYWHTPDDTIDKLSPDSLARAGRIAVRLVNLLTR